jgi:hypothetical protein
MSTVKKYAGLKIYVDGTGKQRVYYRPTGVPLPIDIGSPEFDRAYKMAEAGLLVAGIGVGLPKTVIGTVNDLITKLYAKMAADKSLSPATRITYRHHIEKFRNEFGDGPVKGITRQHIREIVSLQPTPSLQN